MLRQAAWMLACSFVAITASAQGPPIMKKGSAVDLQLGVRAAELIWKAVQKTGCPRYDTITPSPRIRTEDFSFDAARSNVTSGMVVEQWIAAGCGTTYEFEFSFAADTRGGTKVDVVYIKR